MAILDPIPATKGIALLYGTGGLGKTFVALGIRARRLGLLAPSPTTGD